MLKRLSPDPVYQGAPGADRLIHVCRGPAVKTRKQGIEVNTCDSLGTYAVDRKTRKLMGAVAYCPYCGADIEKEARP